MKETPIKKKTVMKGVAVDFRVDKVKLANDVITVREYMHHPGAVAVIAFSPEKKDISRIKLSDRIILVSQYRYPVGRITYEIPAGKLSGNENITACVKRELEEETGYTAGKIKRLLSFWPTPAFSDEIIHLFAAWRTSTGVPYPDKDEMICSREVSLGKVIKWIKSGRIKDAKTIIAILSLLSQGAH